MSGKQIIRVSLGIATAAGAFALAACGSSASGQAAAPPAQQAPVAQQVSQAGAITNDTAGSRCATSELSVSLGTPKPSQDASGQVDVPLTFTNTSARTCGLYGVPGVDLIGPDDPNGPVYSLPRVDNGVEFNQVPAGSTATATITVLTPTEGSVGSMGSTSWTPSTLTTIPPDQTTALTVAWPQDLPVLRQDSATHPGSYVNGILADPA